MAGIRHCSAVARSGDETGIFNTASIAPLRVERVDTALRTVALASDARGCRMRLGAPSVVSFAQG